MALLDQFIDFNPIIDKLWEKFEPKIDSQLDKVREQVMAMLPAIGAAAAKAVIDRFPELIRGFLERDPDVPFISDFFDLSEMIRHTVNESPLPIQIPALDRLGDLFGGRQ